MNINIMGDFIVHQYIESNSRSIYQLYIFSNECLINIYLVENNKLRNYKTNLNYEGTLVEKYELFEYLKNNYKKFVFVNMTTHIIMSDDKYIFRIPLHNNNKKSEVSIQNNIRTYYNDTNNIIKLNKSKYNIISFFLICCVLMIIYNNLDLIKLLINDS